jgi:hypothetical protein
MHPRRRSNYKKLRTFRDGGTAYWRHQTAPPESMTPAAHLGWWASRVCHTVLVWSIFAVIQSFVMVGLYIACRVRYHR